MVKPIIGRVGGKVRLAPWILEQCLRFQWSIWVEPFCGSAAVYFRLVKDGIPELVKSRGHHFRSVLNDADSRIVQLFKTCRDHPELLAYAVAMTPYSREEHRLAQNKTEPLDEIELARRYLVGNWQSVSGERNKMGSRSGWSFKRHLEYDKYQDRYNVWNEIPQRILEASPHLQGETNLVDSLNCLNDIGRGFLEAPVSAQVELARRYLVDGWQSFKKMQGDVWGISTHVIPNGQNGGDASPHIPWHTLPDRILNATDHLKRCYIENDDAVKVIERWATPHTCIYADPPYVGLENYYAHNAKSGKSDNLDLHYRLAETLNTVEAACVAVSYYPCDLVDELYPEAHWERHYKDTVASSAGITRNSKTRTRPKRQELLLIRKSTTTVTVSLSGQLGLFDLLNSKTSI